MPTLQDYTTQVELLVHDLNQIDWDQSQYTSRINLARERVALDTHCYRNFFEGLQLITAQERYPLKGGVGGVRLVSGGQNYVQPIVTFAGGGGTGATATATQQNGVITGFTMTNWGTGYTSTPSVLISEGAGFITNYQYRQALAAYSSTAMFAVYSAIIALPPGDPVFIQWNSGASTLPGDGLWALSMIAAGLTQQQLALIYAVAATKPVVSNPLYIAGQTNATLQGQTDNFAGPAVTNQQFRLALAAPQYGFGNVFFGAIDPSPSNAANMIYYSGASTVPGDALSNVLKTGIGFNDAEVLTFYNYAATLTNSIKTVTNQQLRLAIASYGLMGAAIGAISFSPADPVNIQWNSGAGSTFGDALSNVLAGLTFGPGQSITALYTLAATYPRNVPGSGAAAQAISLHNVLDLNVVSIIWGTERPAMSWFPFSTFQAYCRSLTQSPSGLPAVWTTYWENNFFYIFRIPDQTYGMEWDAICLPDPLVNVTDEDVQIRSPFDELVQYWAAHLCLLKLQQFPQADYFEKKYEKRLYQLMGSSKAVRVTNIYRNRNARIRRLMW